MNDNLKKVADFHKTFEHPIANPADRKGLESIESREIRQLRIKLLFEELAELAEASDCKRTMAELCDMYCVKLADKFGGIEVGVQQQAEIVKDILDEREIHDGDNVDLTEELDALCDLEYVLMGKVLTAGLQDVFDYNFRTVHFNNMRKAHRDLEHVVKTIATKLNLACENVQPEFVHGGKFTYSGWAIIEKSQGIWLLLNPDGKLTKPWDHEKVKLEL